MIFHSVLNLKKNTQYPMAKEIKKKIDNHDSITIIGQL